MKQKILLIAFCIFNMSSRLNAQKVSYELSAGISSAFYYVDENDKCEMSDSKPGLQAGSLSISK